VFILVKCPWCGKELEPVGNKYICNNPDCEIEGIRETYEILKYLADSLKKKDVSSVPVSEPYEPARPSEEKITCPKCKVNYVKIVRTRTDRYGNTIYLLHCPKCGFYEMPDYELEYHIEREKQLKEFHKEFTDFRRKIKKEWFGNRPWGQLSKEEKNRYLDELKRFEDEMAKKYKHIEDLIKRRDKERRERLRYIEKRKVEEEEKRKYRTSRYIEKIGPMVLHGLTLAAFVGIGAVISGILGSIMFFLAFLSWGIYYVIPNPRHFDLPKDLEKELAERKMPDIFTPGMLEFYRRYFANEHSAYGFLRTLAKTSTFVFFIWGLWNNNSVPFLNIVLLLISFIGYYSFRITYDPERPYELMESLMRFVVLGVFVIPFLIFYQLFDSLVLALIAVAFFAIPPIPSDRDRSELFIMYDFYDKLIFVIIMGAVLIGFFGGWNVPKAMTYTFVYFWIVTGIAGFFSPPQARPTIGFLMIIAASIIYGIGPGQQEVGSTFLGPWWPTIQNTFQTVTEPVIKAFSGLADTFRSGWLLLTNPVGYATQLMNGTHAKNPVGETGALGVEITDFTISPIYVGQPFIITVTLQNKGAFDAENVKVRFMVEEYTAPQDRKVVSVEKMKVTDLNLNTDSGGCIMEKSGKYCEINVARGSEKLLRQDITQVTFDSSGITCNVVDRYNLRKKSIPLRAEVSYDYEVDSKVEVEFISNAEWERLTRENKLQLRDVISESSTAPVLLNLGTAGLKNPIKADQLFHIGINLVSDQKDGRIDEIYEIRLNYPVDFGEAKCNIEPSANPDQKSNENIRTLIWNKDKLSNMKAAVIYCTFKPLGGNFSAPTKTYTVTAHAKYRFTSWKSKSARIEFGGYCCSDEDCTKGQRCCKYRGSKGGYCIPEKEYNSEKCKEPKQKSESLNSTGNETLANVTIK